MIQTWSISSVIDTRNEIEEEQAKTKRAKIWENINEKGSPTNY